MAMTTFWDKISLGDVQASFDPDKMALASQMALSHQVGVLNLGADGTLSGTVLEGRVQYHASVTPQKEVLNMLCDCGRMVDGPCVHVLAIMVAWLVGDEVEEDLNADLDFDLLEDFPAPKTRPPAPQAHPVLLPAARPDMIRADWLKHFESLTVSDMRSLASARGVKLKGTLRDQVTEGLLRAMEDPQKLAECIQNLAPDTRRLLDLLCALPGASPDFSLPQIMPYLEAALANGQKTRPLSDLLEELRKFGLYIEPTISRFYPVPLQVLAQSALPDAGLFKHYGAEPRRISPAQPFQTTRLVLRLLLLAQGGRLHCGPRPGGKNNWPMPADAQKSGSEIEIYAEPAYLEASLRAGLARGLEISEAQVDLAARLLEADHFWHYRAPEKLTDRLVPWLQFTPQEQSRQLFNRALSFPSLVELELARKPGFTPWRSGAAVYKAFLESLGHTRLRLARLLARLPVGQWVEIESILRTVHGLQPGWSMEFASRQTDPYSTRIWQSAHEWASIARKRVNPLSFEEWRKTYGLFHLAILTYTLPWLGMLDVGWQGDQPVAVRLSEFGEFLVGRRGDYPLPQLKSQAPALVVLPDWTVELDLDAASLDLINLLLQIAVPASGSKTEGRKLAYRLTDQGLGRAFETGWTLERILVSLTAATDKPLPVELVQRMQPLWEHFGRLQIYEDMTLIEFADDFCLPELLAGTRLSQILVTTFSPRLVAVRTEAAADFVAELQAKGYTPHYEGVQHA
jgi:hypothetical protein